MIPALGIAVYNRLDLLEACIKSIDHPVEELIIVNNGCLPGLEPDSGFMSLLEANGHIGTFNLITPKVNLGVAPAWNAIQHEVFLTGQKTSVLICGNDIEWAPGDLEIFANTVRDFPEADFVFGNHSYSNFLIKASGWNKIGGFDENIELAYLEDGDHWQRIIRTPAKAIHAAGLRAKHEGSATIKSDKDVAARSARQHDLNWDYYSRKWGCAKWSSGAETFATPFNQGGPINVWKLDIERRKRPHFYPYNPI